MVSNGKAPIYIAHDPRTSPSVVEKSKKMAAGSKNSAEKTACCGEGQFQPMTNTFISNNLRTAQTAPKANGNVVTGPERWYAQRCCAKQGKDDDGEASQAVAAATCGRLGRQQRFHGGRKGP